MTLVFFWNPPSNPHPGLIVLLSETHREKFLNKFAAICISVFSLAVDTTTRPNKYKARITPRYVGYKFH